MPDITVPVPPRTPLFCAVLVAAPLCEVVEAMLSPLANGTTAQDLTTIAGAPARFGLSVTIGLLGTMLFLPGLLGLARRASVASPRWAFVASVLIGVFVMTFVGVRAVQGFELALVTHGVPIPEAARLMDAVPTNPIGASVFFGFLATNYLGIVPLGIALLRSRLVPVGAVVSMFVFPLLDLAAPGEIGVVLSHLVLAGAFVWMSVALLRTTPTRRARALADRQTATSEREPVTV